MSTSTTFLLVIIIAVVRWKYTLGFSTDQCPMQKNVIPGKASLRLRSSIVGASSRPCLMMAAGELRIQIQGTKNAFTNVRHRDILLYLLEKPIANGEFEKTRGLAMYGSSGDLTPLCNYEEGSSEFYHDVWRSKMDAVKLKESGRLLRIVSSDRKGENCFILEEYIDSDVYIPIRDPNSKSLISSNPLTSSSKTTDQEICSNNALDIESELLTAKYDAALLRVAILERQLLASKSHDKMKTTSSGAGSRKAVMTTLAPKAIGPYSQVRNLWIRILLSERFLNISRFL